MREQGLRMDLFELIAMTMAAALQTVEGAQINMISERRIINKAYKPWSGR